MKPTAIYQKTLNHLWSDTFKKQRLWFHEKKSWNLIKSVEWSNLFEDSFTEKFVKLSLAVAPPHVHVRVGYQIDFTENSWNLLFLKKDVDFTVLTSVKLRIC